LVMEVGLSTGGVSALAAGNTSVAAAIKIERNFMALSIGCEAMIIN
jgi:hypothetical protein